jgi:hypothetical protein
VPDAEGLADPLAEGLAEALGDPPDEELRERAGTGVA